MHRLIPTLILTVIASVAVAAEPAEFTITLKDHRFVPAEIKVPAGQKIKLIVDNQDASAEEFESYELNREKIVGANARITVWIGPLKAGRYPFFGEFHADTAQGVLIAE